MQQGQRALPCDRCPTAGRVIGAHMRWQWQRTQYTFAKTTSLPITKEILDHLSEKESQQCVDCRDRGLLQARNSHEMFLDDSTTAAVCSKGLFSLADFLFQLCLNGLRCYLNCENRPIKSLLYSKLTVFMIYFSGRFGIVRHRWPPTSLTRPSGQYRTLHPSYLGSANELT